MGGFTVCSYFYNKFKVLMQYYTVRHKCVCLSNGQLLFSFLFSLSPTMPDAAHVRHCPFKKTARRGFYLCKPFLLILICMVADFFYFSLKCKEIFQSIGLLVGVSQKCGRVESTHKKDTAFFNKLTVLLSNFEIF